MFSEEFNSIIKGCQRFIRSCKSTFKTFFLEVLRWSGLKIIKK